MSAQDPSAHPPSPYPPHHPPQPDDTAPNAHDDLQDNQGTDEQLYDLPLPPHSTFTTRGELEAAAKTFAGENGYDLSVRKTWSKNGRVVKIRLGCTRGRIRTKVQDKDRKRLNTPRQTIDCKMFVHGAAVSRTEPDGQWRLYYGELGSSRVHNHPAAEHRSALPGQRRMARTQGVTDIIRHHLEIGDSVAKTHAAVKRFLSDANEDEGMITATDIANERKRVKREELGQMTIRDHMLNSYVEKGFFVRWQLDNDGNLDRLFVAGPRQLKLFKNHCDVVLSDCTFSNNRSNMPVQQLFGVAGNGDTFCIGICFLNGEGDDDFTWSLRQLKDLMSDPANAVPLPYCFVTDRCLANLNSLDVVFPETPSLLCRWQLRQDIEGWARRHLGTGQEAPNPRMRVNNEQTQHFVDLAMASFNASTESEFYDVVEQLRRAYPAGASYLEQEWWIHKERCVTAFSASVMHFDHVIATRQDGPHAQLKKWIQNSQGDLLAVVKSAEPYWDQQADKIRTRLAQAKTQTTIVLQQPFYKATARIIHREVLNKIEEARKQLRGRKDALPECKHVFRTANGRPCRHELQDMESKSGRVLLPTDFHAHWWIDREQASKHRTNPRVFPTVQTPLRAHPPQDRVPAPPAARRAEPQPASSQFERLEAATRQLPNAPSSSAAPAAQMSSQYLPPNSQTPQQYPNQVNASGAVQQPYNGFPQGAPHGQPGYPPAQQQTNQFAAQPSSQYAPLPYGQEHFGYEPAWLSGRR